MSRTGFHHGNERVILPRKHRWTVIGATLLALLALVAQIWFPPARPSVEVLTADSVHPVPDASHR